MNTIAVPPSSGSRRGQEAMQMPPEYVPSIAGGIVAFLLSQADSWRKRIVDGLVGMLMGMFMGPWLTSKAGVRYGDPGTEQTFAFICFATGVIGFILATFLHGLALKVTNSDSMLEIVLKAFGVTLPPKTPNSKP